MKSILDSYYNNVKNTFNIVVIVVIAVVVVTVVVTVVVVVVVVSVGIYGDLSLTLCVLARVGRGVRTWC